MRITIIALGSRGDVQPFVPLGMALQAAGHRVRVATFPAFAPMITQAGLDFHLLRGDAQALVKAAGQGFLEGKANPFTILRALRRSYLSLAATLPQDLLDPALRDTDVLLNQLPGNLFGYDLAEHLGVPSAILAVIPLVRTRFMPMMGFPTTWSRIPGYNALTYRLTEQLAWSLFRSSINRWRVNDLGLPASPFTGPFGATHNKRVPVINGFSRRVVPRPPDWGDHVHVTGWWLPAEPHWEPPIDLVRFLEAGPPPVFIGFGSMPVADPARATALVVEAVRLSGQRAILHSGWAGLGGRLLPEIFSLHYAPYGWLFPRMAAVVHHGGSGTAGFGFHSGVPTIVVPFAFDQFYWGARAAELGVGPRPVPYRELTAERLARAIQTTTDPDMRRRAAELGRSLSDEDGIQYAVHIIQELATR